MPTKSCPSVPHLRDYMILCLCIGLDWTNSDGWASVVQWAAEKNRQDISYCSGILSPTPCCVMKKHLHQAVLQHGYSAYKRWKTVNGPVGLKLWKWRKQEVSIGNGLKIFHLSISESVPNTLCTQVVEFAGSLSRNSCRHGYPSASLPFSHLAELEA